MKFMCPKAFHLLAIFCGWVLLAFFLPLGTATQIGVDEGYELYKAFLCSKGFKLYEQIWNDQPPLHTYILTTVFKCFGVSLLGARVMAWFFGGSLFLVMYLLVRRKAGEWAAFFGVVFLLATPWILRLSLSVMLEVPAIGTGLWSVLALFRWQETRRLVWLVTSSVILGAALQMKLTAAILIPAILVELLFRLDGQRIKTWRVIIIWIMGVFVSFTALGLLLKGGNYDSLWVSHFSSSLESREHVLTLGVFAGDLGMVLGSLIGVVLVISNRAWRNHGFPVVLLLSVVAVHGLHRPWWPYYYLHFAVPMAWLSGYAVSELIRGAYTKAQRESFFPRGMVFGRLLGAAGLIANLLLFGGDRLIGELDRLSNAALVSDDAYVTKMVEYRAQTKWAFTPVVINAFHARVLVPPSLAVLPQKRYWSGRINDSEIVRQLEVYRPEQLLLDSRYRKTVWREFLEVGYEKVYEGPSYSLFVLKPIARRQDH